VPRCRQPLSAPRLQINNYLGHLKDPKASRAAYYEQFAARRHIQYSSLRTLLQRLHREFDALAETRCVP
jgi:hypothetical protein